MSGMGAQWNSIQRGYLRNLELGNAGDGLSFLIQVPEACAPPAGNSLLAGEN